jgi:hypothetical protein
MLVLLSLMPEHTRARDTTPAPTAAEQAALLEKGERALLAHELRSARTYARRAMGGPSGEPSHDRVLAIRAGRLFAMATTRDPAWRASSDYDANSQSVCGIVLDPYGEQMRFMAAAMKDAPERQDFAIDHWEIAARYTRYEEPALANLRAFDQTGALKNNPFAYAALARLERRHGSAPAALAAERACAASARFPSMCAGMPMEVRRSLPPLWALAAAGLSLVGYLLFVLRMRVAYLHRDPQDGMTIWGLVARGSVLPLVLFPIFAFPIDAGSALLFSAALLLGALALEVWAWFSTEVLSATRQLRVLAPALLIMFIDTGVVYEGALWLYRDASIAESKMVMRENPYPAP